jgi:DNA-binding NtrC family response regulator
MTTSSTQMRILVIDDEEGMGWALQRIVEAEGHTAQVAHSAEEALHLVERQVYDLVFVDAKLPDMDGPHLLTRMRVCGPAPPCVLISGYLSQDDDLVQTCLAQGRICAFVGKPFLLAEIRDVLELARRRRETATARHRNNIAAPS